MMMKNKKNFGLQLDLIQAYTHVGYRFYPKPALIKLILEYYRPHITKAWNEINPDTSILSFYIDAADADEMTIKGPFKSGKYGSDFRIIMSVEKVNKGDLASSFVNHITNAMQEVCQGSSYAEELDWYGLKFKLIEKVKGNPAYSFVQSEVDKTFDHMLQRVAEYERNAKQLA